MHNYYCCHGETLLMIIEFLFPTILNITVSTSSMPVQNMRILHSSVWCFFRFQVCNGFSNDLIACHSGGNFNTCLISV